MYSTGSQNVNQEDNQIKELSPLTHIGSNPESKIKMEEFTTLVINITNDVSYDRAFQIHNVKTRAVITLKIDDVESIHSILIRADEFQENEFKENGSYELSESKESIYSIRDIVKHIGFENTTVNFECCSGIRSVTPVHRCQNHHVFVNTERSVEVIDFIVFMLSKGSQVICADFSLKALISNWDEQKFGAKCPFENMNTVCGNIRVRFGIDACKECEFPQLRAIAQLAIPQCNS